MIAPERTKATIETPENAVQQHTSGPKRNTRPCNGRVAAILAHTTKGHKAFIKADTPERFTAKGKTQFNAAKEAMATKHAQTAAPVRIKRVSRAQETSDTNVNWAIPFGSRKVDHTAQAWRAALSLDELLAKRADRKRNILAVLWVLLRYTDHESMTARITWNKIADKAGICRASVGNMLYDLRDWGIIGIVASGRSAEYAAKAGQPATNEAPVYVICRPVGLGLRPQDTPDAPTTTSTTQKGATAACGNNLEPLPVGGLTTLVESSSTRAREKKTQHEPLRGTENIFGHGSAAQTHHHDERPAELWPANRRICSRGQGLSAAAEILRLMPDLKKFSKKNLLHLMKPFFQSGWTVADIHHALNWRTTPGLHNRESWGPLPQHHRETQSYIDHCRALRGALKFRLLQWVTTEGEIMLSQSQRMAATSAQARAHARATTERRAKLAATRPAHQSAAATGAAQARAALEAARRTQNGY